MNADLLYPVAELGGDSDGMLGRPSKPDALFDGGSLHAGAALPFRRCKSQAKSGNRSIVSSIVLLLKHGRPATVFGAVGSIWINAVKRVLGAWFPAHVRKEVLELCPTVTHPDTPATVVLEVPAVGICGSESHAQPRPVFRCLGLSVGCISLNADPAAKITIEATAGLGLAHAKVLGVCPRLFSALAQTVPNRVLVAVRRAATEYRETTELLTRQINEGWHSPSIVNATCNCKR